MLILGSFFVGNLVISATSGVLLLLFPSLLVLFLCPCRKSIDFFQSISSFTQQIWFTNVTFFLERFIKVHISIDSDAEQLKEESVILLSNHRTRIDWMLLWSLGLRLNSLSQWKIILKAPLRQIPIFGWAVQHFRFLFLDRKWEQDEIYLTRMLTHLCKWSKKSSYLLFPEGTDLSESNLKKANAFAQAKRKQPRKYSLFPRTKGFIHLFKNVHNTVDAIYDITMFYVDYIPGERPSEKSLVFGRFPRALHFHIKRYSISEVPTNEQELGLWLEKCYEEKEKLLENFYDKQQLPQNRKEIFNSSESIFCKQLISFVFFFSLFAMLVIGIWYNVLFRLYIFLVIVGYVLLSKYAGNIDSFIVNQIETIK